MSGFGTLLVLSVSHATIEFMVTAATISFGAHQLLFKSLCQLVPYDAPRSLDCFPSFLDSVLLKQLHFLDFIKLRSLSWITTSLHTVKAKLLAKCSKSSTNLFYCSITVFTRAGKNILAYLFPF